MKRDEKIEQKRQQILMAALELFVKKGYTGTKTKEISAAIGISEGLLFHYFPVKEKILESLVEIGVAGTKMPLKIEIDKPINFFIIFTDMLFEYLKKQPVLAKYFSLMAQMQRTEGIPEHIRQMAMNRDCLEYTVDMIEEGQKDGSIREGNAETLAYLYWCCIQGIAEQYAFYPGMQLPETNWIIAMLRNEEKPNEDENGQ